MLSAVRRTRTVPSWLPLMMTWVPSGSAPAATAFTSQSWLVSGWPTGVLSAVRHTRTVEQETGAAEPGLGMRIYPVTPERSY